MQAASGSGMDTGFFTYTGSPSWNEIDVEVLGKNTRSVSLTYHNGAKQVGVALNLAFDAAAAPHHYAFDWEPTYIRWYIDNKPVLTQTGSQLPLPREPQKLYFDMWGSNSFASWLGLFQWPGHPITSDVQCIAYSPQYLGKMLC